ncbi:hypothetical protein D3C78_1876480 [compost metagenome]
MGNGVSEAGDAPGQPLDTWVMSNLIDGVEGLCDYLAGLVAVAIDMPWSNLIESTAQSSPDQ